MPLVKPSSGSQLVGSVHADIGADTSGFEKGAASVKGGLLKMAGQFLSAAAVAGAFQQALDFSIKSAAEAQRVDAQLGAVLASTGGAAGMARAELESLATSLSRVSTYDDEAIKSSEALLLTFTKVGSEVFPEATQAILDMSTAMGTDLQSATIQVGKALNDPIKGLTALSKVGVSFTEQQRSQIKALVDGGNAMEAQKIILAELNKEFGGSALAAAKTYEGQLTILKNEFGNVAEEIGMQLIPALTELSSTMVENMDTFREDRKEMGDFAEFMNYPISTILKWTLGIDENAESAEAAAEAAKVFTDAAEEEALTAKETEQAIRDMTAANTEYLGAIGDVTKEIDNYQEKEADLKTEQAELLAEKEKLIAQGWGAESEAIQDINTKLAENQTAQDENASAFDEATKRRMLSMLEEQLAIGGLNEAETAFLLEQGKEWGIYSDEAVAAMQAAQDKVNELQANFDKLERNIDININVMTNYSESGQAALTAQLAGEKNYTPGARSFVHGTPGKASGGQVWSGQSYMVGEQGMEIFTPNQNGMITPNSRATMGGGGTDPRIITLLEQIANKQEMSEDRLAMAVVSAVQQGAK